MAERSGHSGFGDAAAIEKIRASIEADSKVKCIYSGADMTKPEQIEALFGLRLPSPLGHQGGAAAGVELGDGALLWVLRRLPASMWLLSGPEPLALAEEVVTLE